MAKLTLSTIASRYGSLDALNANNDAVEEAIENTLSRDGTGPNEMEANLDMNSNDILNAGSVSTTSLFLNGAQVSPGPSFTLAGFTANAVLTATAGQTVFVVPTTVAPTSLLLVFVNGIKLPTSSVSFLGSSVTLPAMQAGDEVEVVELKVV